LGGGKGSTGEVGKEVGSNGGGKVFKLGGKKSRGGLWRVGGGGSRKSRKDNALSADD